MFARRSLDYLAQGAYNCVYRVQGSNPPAVLRVTIMPEPDEEVVRQLEPGSRWHFRAMRGDKDDEEFVLLYRARYMLTFLNQFIYAFGPSIVKEIGVTEVFSGSEAESVFRSQYDVSLCEKLEETMRQYAPPYGPGFYIMTQTMEELQGGPWKGTSAEEIFSLLWFLATTQRAIQFQHHDLKPANLLTRTYSQEQTFSFVFEFKDTRPKTWTIQTDKVPVVIDLDFATIHYSFFDVDRIRVGTWHYAPPDALFLDYMYDLKALHRDFNYSDFVSPSEDKWEKLFYFGKEDEDGYDMWAVGMILLENIAPMQMTTLRSLLMPIAREYREDVESVITSAGYSTYPNAPTPNERLYGVRKNTSLMYILINTVITCVVQGSLALPLFENETKYGFRYPGFFFGSQPQFAKAFVIPELGAFQREFNESDLFLPYRDLIRRLMSWNPRERGSQGVILEEFSKPGKIFHPFVVSQPARNGETFTYNEVMENEEGPVMAYKDFNQLKSPIGCAQCLIRPAISQCGRECGTAFYCGQQCADIHYEQHKSQCK